MSYTDVNTPVVEKIELPSGDQFYIADRQIRNKVVTVEGQIDTLEGYTLGTTYADYTTTPLQDQIKILEQTIAGGVAFIIAWNGSGVPNVSQIPYDVVVTYNGTEYTGTMPAASAQAGAFYLVAQNGESGTSSNVYEEYVAIEQGQVKYWQMIGTTQVDLSGVVTDVTLSKQTASVVGANSTFTVTQPTISLSTNSTTGDQTIVTGGSSFRLVTTASGGNVEWNDKDQVTALTGVKVTSQPTVTLTANSSTATGRITYVEAQGTATTTKLSATASGGAVSATGDNVTALTGLGTASTKSAIGANSTFTITQPTITLAANASTATGRVQVTTGINTSTSNSDILKGASVANGVLSLGGGTLTSTYLGATASGANTAWNSKDAVTAVTGYANPTTDTVIGTGSTFNVTQPSVTIASGSTGDVTVATGIGAATTKYLSASASGVAVGADGTDTVIGTDSTFTVTQPTVTPSGVQGGSGFNVITGLTTTKLSATASGGNVAWNSKDAKTVLTNDTSLNVTTHQ